MLCWFSSRHFGAWLYLSEPQILPLTNWDHPLSWGNSELHGYHDYKFPLKPSGHPSYILEFSIQDSSSPRKGHQRTLWPCPCIQAAILKNEHTKNELRPLPPALSFHFPWLTHGKTTFSPTKKKKEAQIKNVRVQNNPQLLTRVNFDCFFHHPRVGFDQTPT